MPINWDDYLQLAETLAQVPAQDPLWEASQRSAVSRAYYSTLHDVRTFITKRSGAKRPRQLSTHKWTRDKCQGDPDPRVKQIGSRLWRMKKKREQADYDDHVGQLERIVREVIEEATSLKAEVRSLQS